MSVRVEGEVTDPTVEGEQGTPTIIEREQIINVDAGETTVSIQPAQVTVTVYLPSWWLYATAGALALLCVLTVVVEVLVR